MTTLSREYVLAINPGSTSTKLAIFKEGQKQEEVIRHPVTELQKFRQIRDQIDYRKKIIEDFLEKANFDGNKCAAVVGRGGLLQPVEGGTYSVNEAMLEDLREERYGAHASNLGAMIAAPLAQRWGCPAYIVDPVVVDELNPIARISGLAGIQRRSVGHVLNQRSVARKAIEQLGKTYSESRLIVAHMGGGISIGVHDHGRIIEMVNGIDGEGPYSPERPGSLPLADFAKKIVTEKLSKPEIRCLLAGDGGLKSYLGETDLRKLVEEMENGDERVRYYLDGMSYQLKQSIGSMAAVLDGNVDAIVLTGGIMYADYIREKLQKDLSWIAPVLAFPGEREMEALYEGAIRVLNGEEEAKTYQVNREGAIE